MNKAHYGEPHTGAYPPDDSDFTWHIHDTDESWGTGISCSACRVEPESKAMDKTVHFNLSRLKEQNAAGVTANEIRQAIYASARADGRDITRA